MLEYSDIRAGKIIIHEGEPCEVIDNHVARTQQRKPQNQVKLKSLLSGRTWNTVFHAADKAEEAEINKKEIKFLYNKAGRPPEDGQEFWFCDPNNPKDRFKLEEKIIGDSSRFLKSNELVTALIWGEDEEPARNASHSDAGGGKIIKITLPIKMEFTIKEAPPSIKGNTASGGGKTAILENGIKIQVPFFVEAGDKIRLNTETGEYVERVS